MEPWHTVVCLCVCLLPAYSVARSKLSADTSNIGGRDRYLLRTEIDRHLVLKLRSRVMAFFAYFDCRGWRSGFSEDKTVHN